MPPISTVAPLGVLVVDKPALLSSAATVSRVKRAIGASRAGHAGTLDPMATGVLVVCVGEATKIATWLLLDDKRYLGTVRLGEATDTADAEGVVVARAPVPDATEGEIAAALARMLGTIEQRVPAYSAIKRGGRPLYDRARRGEVVERPSRTVRIDALELVDWSPPEIGFRLECGKGTYVRSLAEDLASSLGTVGHLRALRRERSGPFDVAAAVPWSLVEERDTAGLQAALVAPVDALGALPRRDLEPQEIQAIEHGQPVGPGSAGPVGPIRLVTPAGRLLAVGEAREGRIWPLRVLQGQSG